MEKEKPIYLKKDIDLSKFLKTDFGRKVKEVYNSLNKIVNKNPHEYLETGVIEEALIMLKYYTKHQRPQQQANHCQ